MRLTPRARGAVVVGALLLAPLGFGPTLAHAGTLADPLEAAHAGLADGDLKGVIKGVDTAVRTLPESGEVVTPGELGALYMVQGAAWHRRGGKHESKAMESFRRALLADPDIAWDTERLGEGGDWTLFEALRDEVRSRATLDPGVPEKTGAAQVFVTGVRVRAGDEVRSGRHLGQVTCDDGTVQGVWTTFDKPVDWFGLCPGGVDTSVVVAEEPEDEWGDLGPQFGGPVGGVADEPAPADLEPSAPEPTDPEPAPAAPAPVPPGTGTSGGGRGLAVGPTVMLGSGGALLAGGTVLYFVMVSPAVDDVLDAADDPASVTRDEADALTGRARTAQGLTLGLLGGGVALAAGGLTWTMLADAPVQPFVGPRMLGVRGSF